jgi:hypothetical protein
MQFTPAPRNTRGFSNFMPFRRGNPMGDCQNGDLRINLDRTLKLKLSGSEIITDAELLAYRELDETLHLTETGAESV